MEGGGRWVRCHVDHRKRRPATLDVRCVFVNALQLVPPLLSIRGSTRQISSTSTDKGKKMQKNSVIEYKSLGVSLSSFYYSPYFSIFQACAFAAAVNFP
jgi:hypothetical protein